MKKFNTSDREEFKKKKKKPLQNFSVQVKFHKCI